MVNKKNSGMKRTGGGSPIIFTQIMSNVSGNDEPVFISRPRAQVKGKNSITYMVPIDPETKLVPEEVLYEHFLDYNNWSGTPGKTRNPRADSRTAARVIHVPKNPEGFTPEEIVECGWWGAVNHSDVAGIDDSSSSMIRDWDDVKSSAKPHLGKIAIIAPAATQKKVIATLQNNFTSSELRRMTDKTGLIIIQGNPGEGNDGCYYRRQEGVETPNIFIRASSDEDTITHEVVHHARSTDQKRKGISRTPFPQDEDDRTLPISRSMMPSLSNLEEAATVAETTARTRKPTDNLGYYTYLQGDARSLYNADRELMIHGKPVRGKRAVDTLNDKFDETNISNLQFKMNGKKARASVEEGRKDGKYPPKKPSTASPAKKTKNKPVASASPKKSTKSSSKKASSNKKPTKNNTKGGKRR